jgi:hypothetical protein
MYVNTGMHIEVCICITVCMHVCTSHVRMYILYGMCSCASAYGFQTIMKTSKIMCMHVQVCMCTVFSVCESDLMYPCIFVPACVCVCAYACHVHVHLRTQECMRRQESHNYETLLWNSAGSIYVYIYVRKKYISMYLPYPSMQVRDICLHTCRE